MKKLVFALLCITISLLTLIGCSSSKQIPKDAYEELVRNLENMGYTIEAEDVEDSIILFGERKWLTLNGSDNMSVYLYQDKKSMEKDASYLSHDGFSYNNGKEFIDVEWVSYPHFFKTENIIILYVGENSEIIQALEELIGPRFAGGIE